MIISATGMVSLLVGISLLSVVTSELVEQEHNRYFIPSEFQVSVLTLSNHQNTTSVQQTALEDVQKLINLYTQPTAECLICCNNLVQLGDLKKQTTTFYLFIIYFWHIGETCERGKTLLTFMVSLKIKQFQSPKNGNNFLPPYVFTKLS